jgi:hypothetical protein
VRPKPVAQPDAPRVEEEEEVVPADSPDRPLQRRRVAKTRSTVPSEQGPRGKKANGSAQKDAKKSRKSERAGSRSKR